MAEYEEKFIVVNTKHLTGIRKMQLVDLINEWGLPKNKYYVCNQDEPYAAQVIKTILDGEDNKLNLTKDQTNSTEIQNIVKKQFDMIMENREKYIQAFVAETGLYPTECEMVEQQIKSNNLICTKIFFRKKTEL